MPSEADTPAPPPASQETSSPTPHVPSTPTSSKGKKTKKVTKETPGTSTSGMTPPMPSTIAETTETISERRHILSPGDVMLPTVVGVHHNYVGIVDIHINLCKKII